MYREGHRLAKKGYTPDQIFNELLNPDDIIDSISDPKQARYFVEALRRKDRKFKSLKNVADQIGFVQRMHQNKKYGKWIKHVNWNTKRKPYIILYQDEFIKDICQLSNSTTPVILGLDRTFELCKF